MATKKKVSDSRNPRTDSESETESETESDEEPRRNAAVLTSTPVIPGLTRTFQFSKIHSSGLSSDPDGRHKRKDHSGAFRKRKDGHSRHHHRTSQGSPRPSTSRGSPRPSTSRGSPQPSTSRGNPQPSTSRTKPKSVIHRRRPNRYSRDHVKLQYTTNFLIRKLPFSRIVRELSFNLNLQEYRYQAAAIEALQAAAEDYIIGMYQDANLCTIHSKRTTLMLCDMQLTKRLRERFEKLY